MEFLTSRQIYHGDLAARNVLLTDNYDVKISDFGLSKRTYRNVQEPLEIRSDANGIRLPLPIRWMALEVLLHQEFIPIKSDVWSYGVLAWEIFTLGNEPYGQGTLNSDICVNLLLFLFFYLPPKSVYWTMLNLFCYRNFFTSTNSWPLPGKETSDSFQLP